jgi:signal transduction histidine kinase/cytochrome b561
VTNKVVRYPFLFRCLHWAYAGLVCAQLFLIGLFHQMESSSYGALILNLHTTCGLLALLAAVTRLLSAPFLRAPPSVAGTPKWQALTANLVHWALLALLVAMPLLGWAIVSARGGEVRLFGLVHLPSIVQADPNMADQLLLDHAGVAIALCAFLLVHVAAVIFNKAVRKRPTLSRIIPPRKTEQFRNHAPLWMQVIIAAGVIPLLGASFGMVELSRNRAASVASQALYDHAVDGLRHSRSVQADLKELLGRAVTSAEHPFDAEAVGLVSDAQDELGELRRSEPGADVDASSAKLSNELAVWPRIHPSLEALRVSNAEIDDITTSLDSETFAARARIRTEAQEAHDLLLLTLAPAILLGVVLVLIIAFNMRALLARMQRLASDLARAAQPSFIRVLGNGEVARVMRDLIAAQQVLHDHRAEKEALYQASLRESDQLRIARSEAEAANRAKASFLAMMSHELRTPLNGVIGLAHVLSGTPLSDKQINYVNTIIRSGDGLLTILNDILDLSKIDAEMLEVVNEPVDIRSIAEQARDLWMEAARSKGVELEYYIHDDVPGWVSTDPTRLRQIILNLVSNALKFTSVGSVSLHVSVLDTPQTDLTLQFDICDTGPGIPEDVLPRLFQSFVQADATTTRNHGGTGLGLAISRKLAGLLGGSLSASSRPGEGSVFTLVLQVKAQLTLSLGLSW